jgi:hypothetical protein
MAKINSTFNGNYYLAHDVDYQKLDEMEQKSAKRARREGTAPEPVRRQTMAIPFNITCTTCNKRIVRGTHGYMNRTKAPEKYLGLVMYDLAWRCPHCAGRFVLRTDLETAKMTGGYKCVSGCRRVDGDFLLRNVMLEAEKKEAAAAKELEQSKTSSHDDFSAFNAKMEAVRNRNQLIDEYVGAKSDTNARGGIKSLLLEVVRSAPAAQDSAAPSGAVVDDLAEEAEEDEEEEFDFSALQQKIRAELAKAPGESSEGTALCESIHHRERSDSGDLVPVNTAVTSRVGNDAGLPRSRFDVCIPILPATADNPLSASASRVRDAVPETVLPLQGSSGGARRKKSSALSMLSGYE